MQSRVKKKILHFRPKSSNPSRYSPCKEAHHTVWKNWNNMYVSVNYLGKLSFSDIFIVHWIVCRPHFQFCLPIHSITLSHCALSCTVWLPINILRDDSAWTMAPLPHENQRLRDEPKERLRGRLHNLVLQRTSIADWQTLAILLAVLRSTKGPLNAHKPVQAYYVQRYKKPVHDLFLY